MKRLTAIGFLGCASILAACGAPGNRPAEMSTHDLGLAKPTNVTNAVAISLRSVEVQAPSWLATPKMQYRLAYADPSRRRSYAESRWAAAPAELIEQGLRRALLSGTAQPSACRLRAELDEFVQVFDSAEQSRAVLELRLSLQTTRSDQVLAQRAFSGKRPATSADAGGGVSAMAELVTELNVEAADWLSKLVKEQPAIAAQCRGG